MQIVDRSHFSGGIFNFLGGPPVWELSIKWQMKGLHVRFDTKLGKWMIMLKNTLTRISEDLTEEESDNEDEVDDSVSLKFFLTVILLPN